jgi:hypothetical protein
MFGKKKTDENLKAFEARMASLRPRADRLDARWQSLVEKETALMGEKSLPSPIGRGAGGEGCELIGGHQFMCIRCGIAAPSPSAIRNWAWPGALAAMTGVAAILLVMLVVAERHPIASPSAAQQQAETFLSEQVQMSDHGLATSDWARTPLSSGGGEASYLELRNQVLRSGVESWKQPVSAAVTTAREAEAPLGYREQLNRLLQQQDLRGS